MARWFELAEMSDSKLEKTFYFTPEVETTAIENTLYQGIMFEYEGLD
jgi:hypothetical protein